MLKQVLAPRTYWIRGTPVTFTNEDCLHFARVGKEMLRAGLPIRVPAEHQSWANPYQFEDDDARRAKEVDYNRGFVSDYLIDADHSLWAELDISRQEVADALRTETKFVSPRIIPEFQDGDGRIWTNVIGHVALTPQPVAHNQKPFGSEPINLQPVCLSMIDAFQANEPIDFSILDAIDLAAAHAPKGGITIQGDEFSGGEFIPSDVVAKANTDEKAKLKKKEEPKRRSEFKRAGEKNPVMQNAGQKAAAAKRMLMHEHVTGFTDAKFVRVNDGGFPIVEVHKQEYQIDDPKFFDWYKITRGLRGDIRKKRGTPEEIERFKERLAIGEKLMKQAVKNAIWKQEQRKDEELNAAGEIAIPSNPSPVAAPVFQPMPDNLVAELVSDSPDQYVLAVPGQVYGRYNHEGLPVGYTPHVLLNPDDAKRAIAKAGALQPKKVELFNEGFWPADRYGADKTEIIALEKDMDEYVRGNNDKAYLQDIVGALRGYPPEAIRGLGERLGLPINDVMPKESVLYNVKAHLGEMRGLYEKQPAVVEKNPDFFNNAFPVGRYEKDQKQMENVEADIQDFVENKGSPEKLNDIAGLVNAFTRDARRILARRLRVPGDEQSVKAIEQKIKELHGGEFESAASALKTADKRDGDFMPKGNMEVKEKPPEMKRTTVVKASNTNPQGWPAEGKIADIAKKVKKEFGDAYAIVQRGDKIEVLRSHDGTEGREYTEEASYFTGEPKPEMPRLNNAASYVLTKTKGGQWVFSGRAHPDVKKIYKSKEEAIKAADKVGAIVGIALDMSMPAQVVRITKSFVKPQKQLAVDMSVMTLERPASEKVSIANRVNHILSMSYNYNPATEENEWSENKESWHPHTGEKGTSGWKSAKTGRVKFGSKPGEHDHDGPHDQEPSEVHTYTRNDLDAIKGGAKQSDVGVHKYAHEMSIAQRVDQMLDMDLASSAASFRNRSPRPTEHHDTFEKASKAANEHTEKWRKCPAMNKAVEAGSASAYHKNEADIHHTGGELHAHAAKLGRKEGVSQEQIAHHEKQSQFHHNSASRESSSIREHGASFYKPHLMSLTEMSVSSGGPLGDIPVIDQTSTRYSDRSELAKAMEDAENKNGSMHKLYKALLTNGPNGGNAAHTGTDEDVQKIFDEHMKDGSYRPAIALHEHIRRYGLLGHPVEKKLGYDISYFERSKQDMSLSTKGTVDMAIEKKPDETKKPPEKKPDAKPDATPDVKPDATPDATSPQANDANADTEGDEDTDLFSGDENAAGMDAEFGQVKAFLEEHGIHLPEDTTRENFIEHLKVALHAIKGATSDGADPNDPNAMPGDDDAGLATPAEEPMTVSMSNTQPAKTKPKAQMSATEMSLNRRLEVAESRLAAQSLKSLTHKIETMQTAGQVSPARAKEWIATLTSKQMSLVVEANDAAVTKVLDQMEQADEIPEGTFWTEDQRTAHNAQATEEPAPSHVDFSVKNGTPTGKEKITNERVQQICDEAYGPKKKK